MPHSLKQKLAVLRRRAWRLGMLHAVSVALAAALASAMLLGLVDFVVHFEDRGLRIMATLVVFGVFAWTCYRYLYSAWTVRLADVDLAVRLEHRFPSLHHQLVSAVEFQSLSDADPAAGSALLRRAVIAQATAETEPLDFSEVLDVRSPLRTVVALGVVCLAAGLCLAIHPSPSWTAVSRLCNPLNHAHWPQKTHLQIRQPVDRIAQGQPFEVAVVDADDATLPEDVFIHYRFGGSKGVAMAESERMTRLDGVMMARREGVTRPFSYRVDGGDDASMPWRQVDVVVPPTMESLSIRLIPPSYSGCREQRSEQHIQALVGTRIEMEGRASVPIVSAVLCFEDGKRFEGLVDADARGFKIPAGDGAVLVERSEAYWLELTDVEGLCGVGDRWGIDAVPDSPPTVAIVQPASNGVATSQAVVPLRVSAKDDLALRSVEIVFRRSPSAPEEVLPLYLGPEESPHRTAIPRASSDATTGSSGGEQRVVQYPWELAPLGLQPGIQITYYATATDYHSQTAKSEPCQLTILTPQEFEDRLAARQKVIAAELERALKMQRSCRSQVALLAARLNAEHHVKPADVDSFQSLQLGQREASLVLTGEGEGLPMHVRGVLADLENNRVDFNDVLRRMKQLLNELDRIDRELLTPIGHELTLATKAAQIGLQDRGDPVPQDPKIAESLGRVGEGQDRVIAALEQLLGPLSQWDSYRRFHRELTDLLRDQESLGRQVAEVGRRTLARELQDLPVQDAGDLQKAASRQMELAQWLTRVLQNMEQAVAAIAESDSAAAMTDAVASARRADVEGRMRTTSSQLGQNQIGQAVAAQKQIVGDLQDICDRLTGPVRRTTVRMDDVVQSLRRRQQAILDETQRIREVEQSAAGLARADLLAIRELARQQQSLQADTTQAGSQVGDGDNLRSILGLAAQSMQKAGSLLAQRNVGQEAEQVEKDALRQLAVVSDLIAEAARRADAAASPSQQADANGQGDSSKPGLPSKNGERRETGPSEKRGDQRGDKPGDQPGRVADASSAAANGVPSGDGRQGRQSDWKTMQSRMRRLWGELPQHAREQMLQSPAEEIPPKYERAIEEYFRRLAEEGPRE